MHSDPLVSHFVSISPPMRNRKATLKRQINLRIWLQFDNLTSQIIAAHSFGTRFYSRLLLLLLSSRNLQQNIRTHRVCVRISFHCCRRSHPLLPVPHNLNSGFAVRARCRALFLFLLYRRCGKCGVNKLIKLEKPTNEIDIVLIFVALRRWNKNRGITVAASGSINFHRKLLATKIIETHWDRGYHIIIRLM